MEEKRNDDTIKKLGGEMIVGSNQTFVLCDLYEKQFGVDVTIKIGEKLIHGHKIILSSTIPYFAGVFSAGFKEDKESMVVMKDIDPDATEMIIRHAYSGNLKINRKNCTALLIAADYLRYQPIRDFCCDYLAEYLDFDDLFQIMNLSNLTNSSKLNKIVDDFINSNFDEISQRSEFLELPFDDLLNIISRDELKSTSELTIFKSLMKWTKYDMEGRKSNFGQLFKQLRLHLISKEDLVTFVPNEEFVTDDNESRRYLFQALSYHMHPEARNFSKELWDRTRCVQEETIYIIGGDDPLRSLSVIEKLKLEPFSSVHQKLPDEWVFHGTALLNNNLYLIGGGSRPDVTNRVMAFDLKTQRCSTVAPMNAKRQTFGTAVLDRKIFVCGGWSPDLNDASNSFELYDPVENRWTLKAPMLTSRCHHAAVALGGNIYAIGGYRLRSVERYDPEKDIWTLVAPMNSNRRWHGAAVYDGKIFVAGGLDDEKVLNTVEVYDPEQAVWTQISSMIHPREDPLLLVYQSKLYAIGGRDGSKKSLTSIEELRLTPGGYSFFWTQVAHKILIQTWGSSVQVIRD